jgi:hypothetical protein
MGTVTVLRPRRCQLRLRRVGTADSSAGRSAPAFCDRGFVDAALVGVGFVGMLLEESHGDLA